MDVGPFSQGDCLPTRSRIVKQDSLSFKVRPPTNMIHRHIFCDNCVCLCLYNLAEMMRGISKCHMCPSMTEMCLLSQQLQSWPRGWLAVASLGLVSPGAANDGVTPIFSWKIWRPFFSHHRLSAVSSAVSPLFIFSWKTDDLFLLITVTFIDFTRVSPPLDGVTRTFLPVRPRLSTILCVTHWRMSPGRSASP